MEERRLADAMMAYRAARAEANATDAPGWDEWRIDALLEDVNDELRSVLNDIEMGRYAPSEGDVRAALEFIADGSAFGWQANELRDVALSALKGLAPA